MQLDEHVADIRAFIAQIVPQEQLPILVGHSFGGMYAQKVRLRASPMEKHSNLNPVWKPISRGSRFNCSRRARRGHPFSHCPGRAKCYPSWGSSAARTANHPGGAFIRRQLSAKGTSPHAQNLLPLRIPPVWSRTVWPRASHMERYSNSNPV